VLDHVIVGHVSQFEGKGWCSLRELEWRGSVTVRTPHP
jgi:hypothetical protein